MGIIGRLIFIVIIVLLVISGIYLVGFDIPAPVKEVVKTIDVSTKIK